MKRCRNSGPVIPKDYMSVLGRLYGETVEQGPKSAPQRTQADGVLPMQHKERKP